MSDSSSPTLTLAEAQTLLRQFTCLEGHANLSPTEQLQVRQALALVCQRSQYQILGICADTLEQGQRTLQAYATALGYSIQPQLANVAEPIYIKFNPRSGLCYADTYVGSHRGVLVSCQSASEDGINETFGHLPLDLFVGTESCS